MQWTVYDRQVRHGAMDSEKNVIELTIQEKKLLLLRGGRAYEYEMMNFWRFSRRSHVNILGLVTDEYPLAILFTQRSSWIPRFMDYEQAR